MREITYMEAINEALTQEMERDLSVFVYGIGVDCLYASQSLNGAGCSQGVADHTFGSANGYLIGPFTEQ